MPVFRTTSDFEKFYSEQFLPLLRYSASIVKDKEDAKDIVQRAFISLWQKRTGIDIHTSAKSYVYKTVYHDSLNFLKNAGVKKNYTNQQKANSGMIVSAGNGSENELNALIESAIAKLPYQCKKIFSMSRFEHLKYREIATELDISEKAVEKQMGKALKLLKEALKEWLPLFLIMLRLIK